MTTRIAILSDLHGNWAATETLLTTSDAEGPGASSCTAPSLSLAGAGG